MTNQRSSRIGDLDITCDCRPDPVPASGSNHNVSLHNTGSDRYIGIQMVVNIRAPVAGCSLNLRHGSHVGTALPAVGLGTVPSGTKGMWTVKVEHVTGGTTRYETIKTTVSFASDAETDPLDDEPPMPYICSIKIDIGVK
jgi:hypothetical protein